MRKLLRGMAGVTVESIGFERDHLDMVMCIAPEYSISSVMGKLKSQSASQLRRKFPWLGNVYWNENIVWSTGYFFSSVGIDKETIRRYVEYQGHQDSGQLRLKL
jgi:putative transposase